MNLKNFAENHGMKIRTILVFIDLKRQIKEDNVNVMKAKKTYIEATPQTKAFSLHKCYIQLMIEKIRKFRRVSFIRKSSKSSEITRQIR